MLKGKKERQTGEEVGRQLCVKGEADNADTRRGGKTIVCSRGTRQCRQEQK